MYTHAYILLLYINMLILLFEQKQYKLYSDPKIRIIACHTLKSNMYIFTNKILA